ncbi:hypothetical protein [Bacteriovorax sp. Seq25_V]|uniref:hypothetical protein n=1 Tax=Bacteriovorax sp. Seq25_V TaxID=1201288 RepID=UPI00038A12DF|nr:hypothetical protein [Bacteriovorax sp. Seq25_V]EQC45400.1 hypothetical protein M900_2242 [Bacteriovorax sp. Seq25_V]
MKSLNKIAFIILMALGANAMHIEAVPALHVYSPKGYNSNDNVEVVVEGVLPNLCYFNPSSEVKVVGKDIEIAIQAERRESAVGCAEMVVPFLSSAQIGLLDKGWYRVMINGQQRSDLYVDEFSSDGMEDEILANVENAQVIEGSRILKLQGQNPSDCFVEERVDVDSNKKDAYSFAAKMKKVSDFCPMKMVPFEMEVEVPNDIEREKVLLHIRSLNGKAINKLFENEQL